MKTIALMLASALVSGAAVYFSTQNEEVSANSGNLASNQSTKEKPGIKETKNTKGEIQKIDTSSLKTSGELSILVEENQRLKEELAKLEKEVGDLDQIKNDIRELKTSNGHVFQNIDGSDFGFGNRKSMEEIAKELEISDNDLEILKTYEAEKEEAHQLLITEMMSKMEKDSDEPKGINGNFQFNLDSDLIQKMTTLDSEHNQKVINFLGEEKGKKYNKLKGNHPGAVSIQLGSGAIFGGDK